MRPVVPPKHRVPPAALSPAPTQPGGARAPRAGSRRGSRHSRPAETSPLIISPDLMGFLCCNSSRHPLPAHRRSPARSLTPLQASRGARARCGGRGWVAGRGCGVRTVQLAARRSVSPAGLQTSLDFAAYSGSLVSSLQRNWVGWWRDPGLGHLSPISALTLSSQNWNLEHNSGETFEDPESPLPSLSFFSGLQQLRSWDWLPSLKFFSCTQRHTHAHTHMHGALLLFGSAFLLGSIDLGAAD